MLPPTPYAFPGIIPLTRVWVGFSDGIVVKRVWKKWRVSLLILGKRKTVVSLLGCPHSHSLICLLWGSWLPPWSCPKETVMWQKPSCFWAIARVNPSPASSHGHPSTFLQSFTVLGICINRHGLLSFISRSTTVLLILLKITLQPFPDLTAKSDGPKA